MPKPRKDHTGQKYNRLTVLSDAPNIGSNRAVECRCDCGRTKIVTLSKLLS